METLNQILASFDLTSIIQALFPSIFKALENGFIIIYDTVLNRLIDILSKTHFILPVLVFMGAYAIFAGAMRLKKIAIKK